LWHARAREGRRTVMQRSGSIVGLAMMALVSVLSGAASAQEYCVACSEPNAVYRCIIEGAKPGGGQSLQMMCITSMAQARNHATCAVKRGTVFDCDGAVKRVPGASLEQQPGPPQGQGPVTAVEPKQKPKVEDDPNQPPRTVIDMAKRANEQTAEQMKQSADQM